MCRPPNASAHSSKKVVHTQVCGSSITRGASEEHHVMIVWDESRVPWVFSQAGLSVRARPQITCLSARPA
eukprot:6800144-Alexandrium_andersonii.AAC.1